MGKCDFHLYLLISILLHSVLLVLWKEEREQSDRVFPIQMVEIYEEVGSEKNERAPTFNYEDLFIINSDFSPLKIPLASKPENEKLIDSIGLTSLLQYLYQRIDNGLHYPKEFKDKLIEGHVYAELLFSEEGGFLRDESTVNSSVRFLKVHVSNLLGRVLKSEIPQSLINYDGKLMLKCSFWFHVSEHNDPSLIKAQERISGKELVFYRNYHHSVAQWQVGPLSGMWGIPYVSIDLLKAGKMVNKLFGGKDPMEIYRNDSER